MSDYLPYRLVAFNDSGTARYLIVHRVTFSSPVSASLYIARLGLKERGKTGSLGVALRHILYLFGWADRFNYDLESALLRGDGLSEFDVEQFCYWLKDRKSSESAVSNRYINQVILSCRKMITWFVRRANAGSDLIARQALVNAHSYIWSEAIYPEEYQDPVLDFTDDQYEKIENYLKGGKKFDEMSSIEIRDFIMWRLCWEFGLRIGEVLALRVQDVCSNDGYQYLAIVRLAHRSTLDPRVPYDPKVKTLSRELGYLDKNSVLPDLLDLYLRRHRLVERDIAGQKVLSPFLSHDFLFISHATSASPLSVSGAQKVALRISRRSGVHVHWHRIRHSFFNRNYEMAIHSAKPEENVRDLVYFGGWRSERSLLVYINRVTRDNARKGLVDLSSGAKK